MINYIGENSVFMNPLNSANSLVTGAIGLLLILLPLKMLFLVVHC